MRIRCLAVAVSLLAGLAAASPAGAELRIPGGYSVERVELGQGVTHLRLTGNGQRINVGFLAEGAQAALRPLQAGPNAIRKPEKPSTMCRRLNCLAAVNADFMKSKQAIGAIVLNSELFRSPFGPAASAWVDVNGRVGGGALGWSGIVSAPGIAPIGLSALNRAVGEAVLYTPPWGGSTGTKSKKAGLVELVARYFDGPPGRIGAPVRLQLVELRDGKGNTKFSPDKVVLSATGGSANRLRELWNRVGAGGSATLSLDTNPRVTQSLGGNFTMIAGGRNTFPGSGSYYTGAQPRSAIGWNGRGEVFLVAVDGRQKPAKGMSMFQLADLLRSLGATDAVNLDGGGGTVFVTNGGAIQNNPSVGGKSGKKGKERPSPNAWAFLRR